MLRDVKFLFFNANLFELLKSDCVQTQKCKMKHTQISDENFLLNLKWLMAGLIMLVIGYGLMYVSPASDNNYFKPEIFSVLSINLAPLTIVSGYVIVGISIFKH